MQFELSICIPTYNRAKYLKDTLDSIINQLDENIKNKVEICVSDNASEDNTKELVENYKSKHPHITYFRWDKNMGADNNYLKVVEISHGKYCWLLGSDDIINENAIKKILADLNFNCDIYLLNPKICDIKMNFLRNQKLLKDNIPSKVFSFGTSVKLEEYFNSIINPAGIFTYLSTLIFLKTKWDSVVFDEKFIGTAYTHTYILLFLLKTNVTLKYINEHLISYRGSNDSFILDKGMQGRIIIDLNGYRLLFSSIFTGYINTNYYIKKVIKCAYGRLAILLLMTYYNENNLIEEALLKIGYRKSFLNFIKILKFMNIYPLIQNIKKKLRFR